MRDGRHMQRRVENVVSDTSLSRRLQLDGRRRQVVLAALDAAQPDQHDRPVHRGAGQVRHLEVPQLARADGLAVRRRRQHLQGTQTQLADSSRPIPASSYAIEATASDVRTTSYTWSAFNNSPVHVFEPFIWTGELFDNFRFRLNHRAIFHGSIFDADPRAAGNVMLCLQLN